MAAARVAGARAGVERDPWGADVPSLVRFIMVLALIGAVVLAGMVALATFVHVTPRPMEQAIPPAKLK